MRQRLSLPRHRSTDDGFTLIEILVVVIIVGVLSGIVGPSWIGYLYRQRMTQVRDDLLGVLRTAQTEAQQKGERRQVTFVNNTPGNLSVTVAPPGGTGITRQLREGSENDIAFSASTNTLTFDSRGAVTASSIPLVINVTSQRTSTRRCVIVTSILGSLKPAEGNTCTTFNAAP
jgi:prepilin-type N-terminal cleavage/methylation domain-containing protein